MFMLLNRYGNGLTNAAVPVWGVQMGEMEVARENRWTEEWIDDEYWTVDEEGKVELLLGMSLEMWREKLE